MTKIGRNDPCPCGSGKKYKKCCFMDEERNTELKRAIRLARTPGEVKTILSEKLVKYVVKVELMHIPFREIDEEVSRVLAIDGKHSLYDLHLLIQRAFNWDNDHMFSFYLGKDMDDRQKEYSADPLGEHITSTFEEPTKSASEAQLRDLNLHEGQEFMYLFDYGDRLLHKIVVNSIEELDAQKNRQSEIVSRTGNAPEQYD